MVNTITYHRPKPEIGTPSKSSLSSESSVPGVPEALSFEKIIHGGTCPPCTLRDFMNYLLYIEFAAENLQFYLWLKDYTKRFDVLAPNEKALSKPVDFGRDISRPGLEERESFPGFSTRTQLTPFEMNNTISTPFTIQPYRREISRVIATYISDGANRQLNLGAKERADLLKNLAATTHPSAFEQVQRTVEWTLKHQAHPNFIRWTICNGAKPRLIFARVVGAIFIVLGVIICAVLTASRANRAYRILGGLSIMFGVTAFFAAWKGMCIILHGIHHRQLRPWELFSDDSEAEYEMKQGQWDACGAKFSYEDQPWVVKYKERSLIRRIFDGEIWVREPALRAIQDTIFLQSLLVALLISVVTVGLFCVIPPGNRF